MPKYIKVFDTHAAYELWSASSDFAAPSVAGCIDNTDVHYNPIEPEYVDLGLPSGALWATCNLGADSSVDPGLFFAWGETEGFTLDQVYDGVKSFNWSDYKYGYYDSQDVNSGMTKYNNEDRKFVLEPKDDAVAKKYGKKWSIPTRFNFTELMDYCNWEYTNNVYIFTSQINNKKLYLYTNYIYDGNENQGTIDYHSNMVNNYNYAYGGTNWSKSCHLGNGEEGVGSYYTYERCIGTPLRPVKQGRHKYEYVDMGLPSGTLWATCNLGADSSTDIGLYFSCGVPVGYDASNMARTRYFNEYSSYIYCPLYDYNGDHNTNGILQPIDDPAYVYLGSDWASPSPEQYEELLQCTSKDYIQDEQGNSVLRLTSNENGNTLLFPFTGFIEEQSLEDPTWGDYWTNNFEIYMYFDGDYSTGIDSWDYYIGMPVRAVNNKNVVWSAFE